MKTIAVIGAGTMGNGIAHVFAQNGFSVTLIDVNKQQLDNAVATIGKNLDRMITKGTITAEQKLSTLSNLTTNQQLQQGVQDAELVIEAATENIELKLSIFSPNYHLNRWQFGFPLDSMQHLLAQRYERLLLMQRPTLKQSILLL